MFETCLNPQLLPVLVTLVKKDVLSSGGFYLAGGTALALQLGHRISEDLDFFTPQEFSPQQLVNRLNQADLRIMNMDDRTLNMLIDGQKVSFFHYPYQVVYPLLSFRGCPMADCGDIAAMKIIAIAQRGSKKDFTDLMAILKSDYSINKIFNILKDKYPRIEYNLAHLVRSLGYFEDAEDDAMPIINRGDGFSLLTQEEWEQIKSALIEVQRSAFKSFIE